jgi:hypothetical protein
MGRRIMSDFEILANWLEKYRTKIIFCNEDASIVKIDGEVDLKDLIESIKENQDY